MFPVKALSIFNPASLAPMKETTQTANQETQQKLNLTEEG